MRAVALLCLLEAALIRANEFAWNGFDHFSTTEEDNACLLSQSACGCCLMHQWIEESKYIFMDKYEYMKEELTTAKMLLSNMTAQRSIFSVSLNEADHLECYGPFPDAKPINFQHTFINLENHYNVNTGIYTVPYSGIYSFSITIYSRTMTGTNVAACASLEVNGKVLAQISETSGQDSEDSATIVSTVKLKAGDKVSAILPKDCVICDNKDHYNTFTGFLLNVY